MNPPVIKDKKPERGVLRKLNYRKMAVAIWGLRMDGYLPQTKYVQKEIERFCRKAGITFSEL